MQLIILTGLSGSGKSVALKALEDSAYYTCDNLPAPLLPALVDFLEGAGYQRVAVSVDFNGTMRLDSDVREICSKAMRRFEELGCIVEEASPDFGPVDEVFMALRNQHFVVDRELQLLEQRGKLKPDIVWNTELGLKKGVRKNLPRAPAQQSCLQISS